MNGLSSLFSSAGKQALKGFRAGLPVAGGLALRAGLSALPGGAFLAPFSDDILQGGLRAVVPRVKRQAPGLAGAAVKALPRSAAPIAPYLQLALSRFVR